MVSANQWVSQHGTGGVLAVAMCSGLWLALFNVLSAWGSWDSLLHLAVTLGYAALHLGWSSSSTCTYFKGWTGTPHCLTPVAAVGRGVAIPMGVYAHICADIANGTRICPTCQQVI